MDESPSRFETEISDLKNELEHFQQEKERVRKIIGKVGGVPTFNTKLINILFVVFVVVLLVVSIVGGPEWRPLMIELATVALSVKIIYLIHCQMKVNHFQFWILSSLEWRLNELLRIARQK